MQPSKLNLTWLKEAAGAAVRAAAALLPLLLLATSCGEEMPEFYNGTGTLDVWLEVEGWRGTQASPAVVDVPSPASFEVAVVPDGSDSPLWLPWGQFEQGQRYRAGSYHALARFGTVDDEGVGRPCYTASQAFTIPENTAATVKLTARLASAPVRVDMPRELPCPGAYAMVHTGGGAYTALEGEDAGRWAFMRPGPTEVLLMVPMAGKDAPVGVRLWSGTTTAGNPLEVVLTAGEGSLAEVSVEGQTTKIDLSDAALSAPLPQMSLQGHATLSLPEYIMPDPGQAVFTASWTALPASLTLNIDSPLLRAAGAPAGASLTDASDEGRAWLAAQGVELPLLNQASGTFEISLRQLLALVGGTTDTSRFTLEAVTAGGLVALSPTLTVNTLLTNPTAAAVEGAVIGTDLASVTIQAPQAFDPARLDFADASTGEPLAVESIAVESPDKCIVRLRLPEGNTAVKAQMSYGGRLCDTFTIARLSPAYTLQVDPFATRAVLKVDAADAATLALVTRGLNIWIDGSPATVLSRDPESGLIVCLGLHPSSKARITASMLPSPSAQGSRVLDVATEQAAGLPNGNFDDTEQTLKYDDLACGGVYSQTIVEIFNRQNHRSYDLRTPKGWATVNGKTFCKDSDNRNTWYMQPSAWTVTETASTGDYAVELRTVAFDPHGEAITPYVQTGLPYLNYSASVPRIAYRAAGRLFLGSYSYNPAGPSEAYYEGIAFGSRPMSLNGYYKYFPSQADATDRGLVAVELLAFDGSVVASARLELQPAADYTAFTLPLSYTRFGVKASRLKVTIASSASIGDIAHETATLRTSPNAPEGCSLGSRMLVDNLSLAY